MSASPERACLAIADISGYTGYLGAVELDHAQDILADVISTIVKAMAPFGLSKLEGDAAFMFLPGDEIDGSSLQDAIEGTYVAFQRRLRDIKQASSCACNACVRIPTLDLKFVAHHGAIARQTMLGSEELVGADVILVHRLLKNSVVQDTGIKAYVLYTQAALDAASIDPTGQGLTEHHEPTDVAGDVTAWIRDLATRWQAELDRPPRKIDTGTQINTFTWEAPTPPSVTFEFLTLPAKRMLWDKTITSFDEDAASGRRGAGTTNHCLHGEDAVREEILEWRPPGYWLLKGFAASVPGEPSIYLSDELEALPGGSTRITHRTGYVEDDSTDPELMQALIVEFDKAFLASTAALVKMLNVVATEAPVTEPTALPDSAAR